jgi:predicted phosphodiesterase
MNKSILHITDLHLDNFTGTEEHLRKGFYKNYIDGFIEHLNGNKVDYLIITGDIVNCGKIENLVNVGTVVDYLISKLEILKEKVVFSIGNHDYKYKEDNGANSVELRKPFFDFASNYANKNPLYESSRGCLYKLSDTEYYLALDPTLDYKLAEEFPALKEKLEGGDKDDLRKRPGRISDTEIDELDTAIREKIPNNSYLIIGCHYPTEKFPGGSLSGDEEDFDRNHVWDYAVNLRNRINKIQTIGTIWLFGDTHAPDHLQIGKILYVMTGRFGTSTAKPSQLRRQAKLINIEQEKDTNIITFYNESQTHSDSKHDIEWKSNSGRPRSVVSPEEKSNEVKQEHEASTPEFIHLIDQEIELQIIEKIEKDNLYTFGRFRTANNNTSLGWVSINPLLNTGKILPAIISKIQSRIQGKLKVNPDSSIIIGLDFWGAIISSQVSICTGIPNYCNATRGHEKFYSEFEVNHNIIVDRLNSITDIVIFTDVVSCGATIHKVIEAINKLKKDKAIDKKINFHVISVITDKNEYNMKYADEISSFGSFCINLRIPIIEDSLLPSSLLVPYKIDLTDQS